MTSDMPSLSRPNHSFFRKKMAVKAPAHKSPLEPSAIRKWKRTFEEYQYQQANPPK